MVYSALNITVPTWQDQKVTWRPGNRPDLFWLTSSLSQYRSDTQVLFSQWCGTTGYLSSVCWGSYQGQWRSRGYTEWDLNVRVAPVGPARCIRLTSHFLCLFFSLYLFSTALPTKLNTHTRIRCSPSTHSLVSGNLNAGVSYTRKTPMLKKTGTCTAKRSCHQNLL